MPGGWGPNWTCSAPWAQVLNTLDVNGRPEGRPLPDFSKIWSEPSFQIECQA